ncbi:hypothetical protein QBC42DRAFT_146837, partial [Cladorrhinum samala]
MSTRIEWVHPDITFVPPRRPVRVRNRRPESDTTDSDASESESNESDEDEDDDDANNTPFPFERLPWAVQLKIFKMILHKEGELVHCLSRLDPFKAPDNFPDEEDLHGSGLINRFFWGRRTCSISTDTRDPNEVLGLLLVSKRFHWIGVHIFYGLNTFAFSSLGEFYRFCKGIGKGRVARIQHVELTFTGNQYLTVKVREGEKRIPFSFRTYALLSFVDMHRLKTLVVHVNETGKNYIRRRYEPEPLKELMARKTAGQPNQRLTRALRNLQGIDYLYQLRGLEWIRFYDLYKEIKLREVRPIVQDWSFIEDITRTSTNPKVPSRFESSKLENLRPLLRARLDANDDADGPAWQPSEDDWRLVKSVYKAGNGWCS